MKISFTLVIFFSLTVSLFVVKPAAADPVLLAQAGPIIQTGTPTPEHGCQTVDVRCVCENPKKDVVLKDRKVGKVNPGEPGQCLRKLDIDEFYKEDAIAYCLPEGTRKDPSKPQSKCRITWDCKKPCILKK